MEPQFTQEEMENLVEAWHRHVMALLALSMNLTTIADQSGYSFDGEAAEVFALNLKAILETAQPLDGGEDYTRFITEVTEVMAEVFAEDDTPNRNLI